LNPFEAPLAKAFNHSERDVGAHGTLAPEFSLAVGLAPSVNNARMTKLSWSALRSVDSRFSTNRTDGGFGDNDVSAFVGIADVSLYVPGNLASEGTSDLLHNLSILKADKCFFREDMDDGGISSVGLHAEVKAELDCGHSSIRS